ncbi:hypothetical protein DPMN_167818 [Dreissena polymorpha]|uniref:Uncharacterized protein n=1 Tax=Dreissena polymorpha TaxID=45954 RepID=A0A9D4IZ36_DREPO|nr:hypothetical protein DPMN_167818 [Dreissena polymorpha]
MADVIVEGLVHPPSLVHINGLPEPLIIFAMATLAVHMHPFINMGAVQRRESVRFTKQTSFETN